jgi:hypothetical protein
LSPRSPPIRPIVRHLVRAVAEDHVGVRADEREVTVVVRQKHCIGDARESGAMELFRLAQVLV